MDLLINILPFHLLIGVVAARILDMARDGNDDLLMHAATVIAWPLLAPARMVCLFFSVRSTED